MSALSFSKALRNGSSALALSTIALIGAPAAQAGDGIFGGGSTLASLAERQLSANFYGFTPSTTTVAPNILLLYAAIGSGSGQRIFISNDPAQGFLGAGLDPATPPDYLFPSLGFSTYPYPRIDFGASDSPLPANFTTGYTTTTYNWDQVNHTRTAAGSVSYPTASYGQPIQLPLFEAPVAVAVNLPEVSQSTGTTVAGGVTWTIKSQLPASPAPYGGRIQLSTAQICAVFSGLVTDWSSNATIPTLSSTGVAGTEGFADANTWRAASTAGTPGSGGGTVYAGSSKPITIVYRADGSGTSFIFTNYLKTVCPLLDPSNTYGYQSIFVTSVLPNNSFTQLINKVTAYGRTLNTVGADGSDAVAAAIGNNTTNHGYIGYLSADFVQPNNTATTSPYAANVQNDYLRANSVYHPGQTISGATTPSDFAAPSPLGAEAAWAALTVPTTADFNAWNVYAQTFPANTNLPGSPLYPNPGWVDIGGRSILPLASGDGAYPLTGTAYGFFYSCYGAGSGGTPTAASRVSNLVSYLKWHYKLSSPAGNAEDVIIVNGFGPLPTSWTSAIASFYLSSSSTSITAYGASPANGCTSVTGTGAH
ncbi:substrate-binding domain-containing protein [Methylosinus sp. H3A]|uniref:substrate-binding domain-containing protein n=1 Tax=Methylosinus sp. H3A TaxID=2785786 RepID=UPI0018C29270|nr:substrate-binding domain-containing protein [Methylosinus sp. H3A]MBG0812607.1 substrate-binding domain-containing protein [Methylosinus sp. H3A]